MDEIKWVAERFGVLDYIPAGIFVLRADFVALFWNSRLEEWTGLSRQQIVGQDIRIHFPHLDAPKYAGRLQHVFEGGPPAIFSSQLHQYVIPSSLPDGQPRLQHTTVNAIPDADEVAFYALFSLEDVTDLTRRSQEYRVLHDQAVQEVAERKQIEAALRESERDAREFQERLKALHEVSIELSQTATLDDLYRRAVELGRSKLGFDRLGLWLLSEDGEKMIGTFGTDEEGNLCDERGLRHEISRDLYIVEALRSNERVTVWEDRPLMSLLGGTGRGWAAVASMWDGDQAIGWLSADNLIQQKPRASYEPELLTLFGTTLGYLVTRKRAEDALRESERDAREFQERLMALHEVSIELAQMPTLDGMYRRAVELGRSKLGFDRLGLWLLSEDGEKMLGTFGTDEAGNLRDERGARSEVIHEPFISEVLRSKKRMMVWQDKPLMDDRLQEVGSGWSVMASMWDGDQSIGWVATDNLIRQEPFASYEPELLTLFGTTLGYLVTRKRAEDTLRESEERYRALFERTNDAVFIISLDAIYLEVNQRAADMLGCTIDEIVGGSVADVIAPDEQQNAESTMAAIMAGQLLPVYERIFRRKDGTEFPVEINIALVYDAEGNPSHTHSIVRDITERKRAEEALAQERNLLRTVLDNAIDYIYVKDTEGRIMLSNPSHLRSIGIETVDDVIGKTDLTLFPPKMAEQFYADEQVLIRTGQSLVNKEELSLDRDGNEMWGLTTKVPLWDKHGKVIGLVGITRDITERKRAEDERLALAVERERVAILGRFIRAASQEFRTPLTVINTSLYVLERVTDPEKRTDRMAVLREQLAYIHNLVEAILTAALLESGEMTFHFLPLNLSSLARDAEYRLRPRVEKAQLTFTVEPVDELLVVRGDGNELYQALAQFIDNAVQYTPQGGAVTVRTCVQDDSVVIEVRDTGIGIDEADLPHIFEHFYRADQAMSARRAGLGLSIAQKIIEAHGGRIEVESVVGGGSTFRVILPVVAEDEGDTP